MNGLKNVFLKFFNIYYRSREFKIDFYHFWPFPIDPDHFRSILIISDNPDHFRSILTISDRSRPFLTVHDRSWPFLTDHDRSLPILIVPDRSWPSLTDPDRQRSGHDRSWPIIDADRQNRSKKSILNFRSRTYLRKASIYSWN